MKRHAKASSAGSILGRGNSVGSIRRAFATRGVSRDAAGSGASTARSASLIAVLALLALALLPVGASAFNTRVPTAFSPIDGTGTGAAFTQSPKDVAVDQSTGNVFVLFGEEVRIFNAEGGIPVGVASPYSITGLSDGRSIEVDNSATSPSKGAVYVATSSTVKKFVRNAGTETYEAVGELVGTPPLAGVADIAADPHGNVFVSCTIESACNVPLPGEESFQSSIVKFGPTGTQISRTRSRFRASDLAVDAVGNLFLTGGTTSASSTNAVWKYPLNGSGEIEGKKVIEALPGKPIPFTLHYGPIATDTVANKLYVSEPSRLVAQYDATSLAKSTTTFGPDHLTQGGRFAVNPAADRIYSVDFNKVVVFGAEVPLATVNVGETTSSGTKATLNAAINPLGTTVEDCKFEYGMTTSYGTTKPCEGAAIPVDSNFHAVSLALAGLTPQGQTYHFRLKVKNSNGTVTTDDQSFTTPDIYATDAASPVTTSTATLRGTIRPEGAPLNECKFEYGAVAVSEASVSCSPGAGSITGDFGEHPVSAALAGLKDHTTYVFRISASSSLGSFKGVTRSFVTGGPTVAGQSALAGRNSATITSYVNPRGFATSYRYEYGPTTSYGGRVPAEADSFAGSGTALVKGTGVFANLESNTTYHYRVVASSEAGTTFGPDQEFTTTRSNASCPNASIRAGQTSSFYPEGTIAIPDCMALEMISPPTKYNQAARRPAISASGDRVRFWSIAALADTPKLGTVTDEYVTTRTSSGWTTSPTQSPAEIVFGKFPCTYSTDLSRWNGWGSTAGQGTAGMTTAFTDGIGEPFTAISPLLTVSSGKAAVIQNGFCEGGSADASHVFFSIGSSDYVQGDPVPSTGTGNVYETYLDEGTPSVELVQRDKDGVVYGGRCGATLGDRPGAVDRQRGSVSADASRVYFTTRPSQPEGEPCDTSANKNRIMVRVQTSDGPVISELIASECTRVSPACSVTNGDDGYLGASQEGTRVLFTTTRQLANSDLDTTNDLYLYDSTKPLGSRLTQVTAGDASNPSQGKAAEFQGLADFSGDGTHVYFIAKAPLTTSPNALGKVAEAGKRNLYLYERDAEFPSGRTAFVATMASGDAERIPANAVPAMGSDVEDLSVGGDGHVLVFITKAPLSPDDTDGGSTDIYRYDASTGSLERITKAAPGGSENGGFDADMDNFVASDVSGPAELAFGRSVSEDGRTVVFRTKEGLDPSDTDGEMGSYIWHAGSLGAVPVSEEQSLSMRGNEVVFVSKSRLLSVDGDAVEDVYALRASGGYPPPVPPTPCQAEACQEPFRSQPGAVTATSESFSGPGNAKTGATTKKPKKHRKHKKQKNKAKQHKSKRASHKQGGQK